MSKIFRTFAVSNQVAINPHTAMAKVAIKSELSKQAVLFPLTLDEIIAPTHPVRVIKQVIKQIDLSPIFATYKGGGNSCFHPRTMLAILVYAYMNGIYSSRKIAQQVCENINYMWLAGMNRPDYRTINYFRGKRLKNSIEDVFVTVVEHLHKAGFVSLKVQYIDGTKIESAANKYTFVWRGSVEKNDAKLRAKLKCVLQQIEDAHQLELEEMPEPMEMSVEDFTERCEQITQNIEQEKLTKKEMKQLKTVKEEYLPRLDKYCEQLAIMGERNSYSKTDPDATFMRLKEDAMRNGQLKPAYNVQISTENQFITNYKIYPNPADTLTLPDFLETFEQRYGTQSESVIADAGYGSEQNYECMEQKDIQAFVKYNMFHKEQTKKYKDNPFLPQNLFYNAKENYYVCPMGQHLTFVGESMRTTDSGYKQFISTYTAMNCDGCPLRGQCFKGKGNRQIEVNHKLNRYKQQARELLMSEEGLYHRGRRCIEPEAVFGQIKQDRQFRRFHLWGKQGARAEFGLVAIAHNLKKMWQMTELQRVGGDKTASKCIECDETNANCTIFALNHTQIFAA